MTAVRKELDHEYEAMGGPSKVEAQARMFQQLSDLTKIAKEGPLICALISLVGVPIPPSLHQIDHQMKKTIAWIKICLDQDQV